MNYLNYKINVKYINELNMNTIHWGGAVTLISRSTVGKL